jgi:uncharacterized DUF497 family protein
MEFEFDPVKSEANLHKHKIDFNPNPAELTTEDTTDQREIDCRRQLRRSEQRESKSTEGE